jgi:hypothetical protein
MTVIAQNPTCDCCADTIVYDGEIAHCFACAPPMNCHECVDVDNDPCYLCEVYTAIGCPTGNPPVMPPEIKYSVVSGTAEICLVEYVISGWAVYIKRCPPWDSPVVVRIETINCPDGCNMVLFLTIYNS